MTYGLQCLNDSGELTLSSNGYLFGYLGKATYVSTTSPGTSTTDSFNGFSAYTFNWAGPIVCAIGLIPLHYMHIESVSQSGSTWTIKVCHSAGSTNALGFFDQTAATDIYVWGLPTVATLPAFGMALYDALGNLTGDLSRRPLQFRDRVLMGSGTNGQAMSGYTKPAILGGADHYKQTSVKVGAIWQNRIFAGTWIWDTGVSMIERSLQLVEYFQDDGGIPAYDNSYPNNAVLIEANGLT